MNMHTSSSYDDLRQAIRTHVLKRRQDGAVIAAKESEGATADWLFDFRALMLQPHWLNRYAELFWERYGDRYPFQVAGMETAGIALVAAIVMKGVERGTPVSGFFIRKSRKRQGLMKMIEGTPTDDPIILVDDLMNTGGTIHKQIEIIASLGKTVTDVFVLLVYRAREAYRFADTDHITLSYLFTLEDFGIRLLATVAPLIPKESFKKLWHFGAPDPSFQVIVQKSAPVLDDRRIFFGSDAGIFRALDQETGEVLWEYAVGPHPSEKGILSSPALHDGVVYFGAYDGNVYALDAVSGDVRWMYAEADWVGSSPSLAPDLGLLFIGLEFGLIFKRGGIAAISLHTGKRMWVDRTPALTHGSPLYIPEEGMVVVGSNDGVVYAYAAKTGELRWRYQTGSDVKASFAYDPKRRLIVFGSMDAKCYALAARDGSPVFARQTEGGIYSTPLVHEDTAYVASLDKRLYAIDLDTGQDRWVYSTSGRIFSSPVFAEGSIWIGSNDGRVYEIDPDQGQLRNFFQATERITNKIAYNGSTKRFFIPTCANEIYCIERNLPK
jgi:outer membrane protein assembly factor BamB/orotate phosphoribosyltransferase